ncbi:MAG: choice-of-anchor tandem repeat GloVer-containing protein [Verrucomicrobiota bacterium]
MKLQLKPSFPTFFLCILIGSGWVSNVAAQTVFNLRSFTGYTGDTNSDGAYPSVAPTLSGNALYGTTSQGGLLDYGTVYKVNTDGSGYKLLYWFGVGGTYPSSVLTLSSNTLYGTALLGGNEDAGTLFRLNTDGSNFTVLTHFGGSAGYVPMGNLALSGNTLYGATSGSDGTTSGYGPHHGTIYRFDVASSNFTTLQYFPYDGTQGANPKGGLVISGVNLYGTTQNGGSSFPLNGTIFRMLDTGGGFQILKNFDGTYYNPSVGTPFQTNNSGAFPNAGLTISDGTLYGTTPVAGHFGRGTLFKINLNGSAFTVLKHFTSLDGTPTTANLIVSNNTIYGTTSSRTFKINTDGSGYTVLYTNSQEVFLTPEFSSPSLKFYGATYAGGNFSSGSVIKFDPTGIPQPSISFQVIPGAIVINWNSSSFLLQSSLTPNGVFTNIPGATSPFTNPYVGPQKFFRLISQ